MKDNCGQCKYLKTMITRNGIIPECSKDKKKFKERETISYSKDKDLILGTCELFDLYTKKY